MDPFKTEGGTQEPQPARLKTQGQVRVAYTSPEEGYQFSVLLRLFVP